MKNTLLAAVGLCLFTPALGYAQDPPPVAAPGTTVATVSDFIVFARAIRPLCQGQLTSVLTMDLKAEGKTIKVRADFKQTYTAAGKYVADISITPPGATTPKRYRVYGDGKMNTVHDIGANTYAIQAVAGDEFFTRGLLAEMARASFAKMPPDMIKILDSKTVSPEVAAVLKDKLSDANDAIQVRRESRNGKSYKVFVISAGDKKETGPVEIFVDSVTGAPEFLQLQLKQEQVDVLVSEKVLNASPVVPAATTFRFTPTKGIKKINKIDIGGF